VLRHYKYNPQTEAMKKTFGILVAIYSAVVIMIVIVPKEIKQNPNPMYKRVIVEK
jgi:hypothetical protein